MPRKLYTFSYMIGNLYSYALNTECVYKHKFGSLSRPVSVPVTRPIRRFHAVLVTLGQRDKGRAETSTNWCATNQVSDGGYAVLASSAGTN